MVQVLCLCLILLINVVYLPICAKLGLVVGMTKQMSDSELLTLENHVDFTSFGRHDFSRVNNSLRLPPYHRTFVYCTPRPTSNKAGRVVRTGGRTFGAVGGQDGGADFIGLTYRSDTQLQRSGRICELTIY